MANHPVLLTPVRSDETVSLPPAPVVYAIAVSVPLFFFAVVLFASGGWGPIVAPVLVIYNVPPILLGTVTLASANSKPAEGVRRFSFAGWVVRDALLAVLGAAAVGVGLFTMRAWFHWGFDEASKVLLAWGPYAYLLPIGAYGMFSLAIDLRRRLSRAFAR